MRRLRSEPSSYPNPRQKSSKTTADLAIAAIGVTQGAVVATGIMPISGSSTHASDGSASTTPPKTSGFHGETGHPIQADFDKLDFDAAQLVFCTGKSPVATRP
jgi:hypothetical protein